MGLLPEVRTPSFQSKRPSAVLLGLALLAIPLFLRADIGAPAGLPDNPQTKAALDALNDNLPRIAVEQLRAALEDESLSQSARLATVSLLGEAQVRAKQFIEALETLPEEPGSEADNTTKRRIAFWRAEAYLGTGNARRAADLFSELAKGNAGKALPFQHEAGLSAASLHGLLGDDEETRRILESMSGDENVAEKYRSAATLAFAELILSDGEIAEAEQAIDKAGALLGASPKVEFLKAKLLLKKEDWQGAAEAFGELRSLPATEMPARFRHSATLYLADCEKILGRPEKATELLVALIEQSPASPILPQAFEKLSQLGFLAGEDIDPRLNDWTTRDGELGALASYFLGVAQMEVKNPEAAILTFGAFIQSFPAHPLKARALLRLSELYSDLSDKKNAILTLNSLADSTSDPAVLARIDFLRATADFTAGDFKASQEKFSASANSPAGAGSAASFNAALAALRAGDNAVFELEQNALLSQAGTAGLGAELILERGLHLADGDRSLAIPLLEGFLRRFPKNPRSAEADLALASLYLLDFPSRDVSARTRIESARGRDLDAGLREEADYISFWIEESSGRTEDAIKAGDAFLKAWPEVPRASAIRFKMGEVFFRDADYPNALTQFQHLLRDYPQSGLAEQATFFAGKSAMMLTTEASLEDAIKIWERVARGNGPLALPARLHQAKVKQRQNKIEEALALYDRILESDPDPDLYFFVVAAKGELIYRTANPVAEEIEPAVEIFADALAQNEVPLRWQLELLYRLGKCHEKANEPTSATSAVSAYYRALRLAEDRTDPLLPDEYTWFYRCGDAALRLLEKQKNAEAAIAICDRLQKLPGPRAQEAATRAERLRLENFEWE